MVAAAVVRFHSGAAAVRTDAFLVIVADSLVLVRAADEDKVVHDDDDNGDYNPGH